MDDEELNEENLEEQENEEEQGLNPEKAKDEVKDKIKAQRKMRDNIQKVQKAQKAAQNAKKVKAAAQLASGAKKFAILANPYFWIGLLIVLAIIVLIGLIMSFTVMPSNFMGKTKKFVEGMMQQFCGFIWGDNTSPINNSSEDVKDLANYIQNMGYDIQGYGFGDVEYTNNTEKEREKVKKSDEKANAIEGKRNYVTEEQATQGGEIKKVYGLQAVTTVSSSQYKDGDEMYSITGRFSSKNNDYLRAYLSAEAATYTEATYSIKGLFNELGDLIKGTLDDIFGGNSAKEWEDPGDVGIKSSSTGMLNFTNEGGNSIFNSTLSGSPTKIKIDPKKRKLMLYEHALNLGIAKIQWGHTFSVDLSNWTALYGRPLELFLALHLSSMMPDLPYQIAVDQAFNTKVNITLQDVKVNLKSIVKIDGREVDINGCNMQEVSGGLSLTDTDGHTFTTKMNKKTFEKLKDLIEDASAGTGVHHGQIDVISDTFISADSHQNGHRAVQAGCFDGRCMIASQNDDYGSWQNSNYGGRIAWFNATTKQYEGEIHIGPEGGHMDGLAYDNDRNMVLKEVGSDLIQIDNNTKDFADPKYCHVSTSSGSYCYDKARHQLMGISGSTVRFYTYNSSNNTYEEKSSITLEDFHLNTDCLQGMGADGLTIYVADSHPDYSSSEYRVWTWDYSGKKTGEYTLGDGFNHSGKEVETLTFDDQNNLWVVVPEGFYKAYPIGDGIKIKFPYVESVTNHWYYHIIDFIGTVGENTPYGAYKKAHIAQKTIKYADEDADLEDCEVELTALLSSGSGIFYQVCEPYLNDKPSVYLKKVFHGAYYKYDGTTETARKIAAARAIEAKYGTDNYNDKKFEKSPSAIANKNITYNWHSSNSSSSKLKVTLEDATEYVAAKKAQVKIQKQSDALIDLDDSEDELEEEDIEEKLDKINKEAEKDEGKLELEELGEESPMCKKLVDFKSDKSNTLEAFSILENVNSEAADVNYRLLKKLMIEMDYFTEEEMSTHEKNILLWIANVEGTTGKEVAEKINENLGQTTDNKYKTISDTSRDANEYGVVVSNFMENTQIIAPGDAKVKKVGTDEHGGFVELEFTTLTDDKVYPVQGHMMLLHQDNEKNSKYNVETPFDKSPEYSAAEVMRRYRFKDTYQVFGDDDVVGITMKISGLRDIKVTAGSTVLRGQEIAESPETAADKQELNNGTADTGDKIYISMKRADKTKIENVEDYIDPIYTYEDEKEMAEQLWYLDHPEKGNKYDSLGRNLDYVQWALEEAENPEVGYCQTHRQYNENSNGSKDVDCSSFVYYALKENGYDVAKYTTWPFTTSNEPGILIDLGFTEMDFPGPNSCQEGDILWRDGHTEIYSGDGKSVGAHGADNLPGGHPSGNTGKLATNGDQTGGEVSEVSCSSNWTKIYRPAGGGSGGSGGSGGGSGGGSEGGSGQGGKDVVEVLEKWKKNGGGHSQVVKAYNENCGKYGKSKMDSDDQWCSETASAAYAEVGKVDSIGGMASNGFDYEKNAKKINAWVSDKNYKPSRGDIQITHDSDGARHTAVVMSCDGNKIKLIAGGGKGIHYKTMSVGASKITGYVVPKKSEDTNEDKDKENTDDKDSSDDNQDDNNSDKPTPSTKGKTYYVSKNGSDSNSGTEEGKPLKKIQTAIDKMKAGDKLIIKEGTYHEKVKIDAKGVSGKPIQIEGSGKVKIDGENHGGILLKIKEGSKYIDIKNITFENLKGNEARGISVEENTSYLKILNCKFYNITCPDPDDDTANAIYLEGSGSTREKAIDNVVIKDCKLSKVCPGWSEGISVDCNCTNITIDNVTATADGAKTNIAICVCGNDKDTNSHFDVNRPKNVYIRNCNVSGCKSPYGQSAYGIYVDSACNVTIENNTVTSSEGGIEVGSEIHKSSQNNKETEKVVVKNNKIKNCLFGMYVGGFSEDNNGGYAYDVMISNNEIIDCGGKESEMITFDRCNKVSFINNTVKASNKARIIYVRNAAKSLSFGNNRYSSGRSASSDSNFGKENSDYSFSKWVKKYNDKNSKFE